MGLLAFPRWGVSGWGALSCATSRLTGDSYGALCEMPNWLSYLFLLPERPVTGKVLMIQGQVHQWAKACWWQDYVTARRRGVRVAPFKAQNMSNNAAVCLDGSEIGRAQAVQALASGLEPHADMNPVLIKPEADSRSQVVVMGRAWQTLSAREYYPKKEILWKEVPARDRLAPSTNWW
jgi:hypothetical protein